MSSLTEEICSHLSKGFEKDLFDAAMANLMDLDNSLRLNNFSFAASELIRIYLEN